MRILTVGNLYPPHHLGGYELVWQAAVRALREAGHEVRVLTTDHRLQGAGPDEEPGVHRDLRWYWRDHAWPRLSWRERWAVESHNRRVFDEHAADADLVSWWAMGGLSMSLLGRAGLPEIGWVNDEWLYYGPHVDQWRRLTRRRVRVADTRWVFCSQALLEFTRARVKGLRDVGAEHQGVAREFTEQPVRDYGRRLLYVGRLDARKGIATAIEALAHLPGATLRVVGDGDPAELARLRALGGPVTFESAVPRSELPAIYADADVTVFPVTWFEPFGLVPLESMAVGRAVVATGTGGSGDYLRDGENCLLFAPGDAQALAAAIERLDDPALRERLRAGGLRTASELTEERWTAAVVRAHDRGPRAAPSAAGS